MVDGRRGFVLLEISAALVIAVLVLVAAAAMLVRHARSARVLYEEQVAQEAAASGMEALEASAGTGLAEGRVELPVDLPGWENLGEATCTRIVAMEEGGFRRVRITVQWKAFDGRVRNVELRTRFGGGR